MSDREAIENLVSFSPSVLELIRDAFLREILQAQAGSTSSLSYLPTPVPGTVDLPIGERIQVLMVGGTNYYTASIDPDDNTRLTDEQRGLSPVFTDLISWVKFVGRQLEPETTMLAINFAFPLKSERRGSINDGILLQATKEHAFAGLVGKLVGATTEKYLVNLARKKVTIALANDAVCLLLGKYEVKTPENLVCSVLATGFNTAFLADANTVINLEAGNFDKFPLSYSSVLISKESLNHGQALEKEIAGKYLFLHYNLLKDKIARSLEDIASTKELYDIALDSEHRGAPLARALFERSAAYFAAIIAGLQRFRQQEPLDCLIEGSLFWNGWKYPANVRKYLKVLGIESSAIHFIRADEQLTTLGTARLLMPAV